MQGKLQSVHADSTAQIIAILVALDQPKRSLTASISLPFPQRKRIADTAHCRRALPQKIRRCVELCDLMRSYQNHHQGFSEQQGNPVAVFWLGTYLHESATGTGVLDWRCPAPAIRRHRLCRAPCTRCEVSGRCLRTRTGIDSLSTKNSEKEASC